MIDINKLRNTTASIIALGSHPRIFQSILDYDFLCGKKEASLKAIVQSGRKYEKYFFGEQEMLIPMYGSVEEIPQEITDSANYFLNVRSARRAINSSQEMLEKLSGIVGGSVFAEDVPEKLSLDLFHFIEKTNKFVIGPASIGLLIPGVLKLGAIGGVDYRQFVASQLFRSGSFAVMSASGGMTNEIIRIVSDAGHGLSFALSFGGDRFPVLPPYEAFLAAEKDTDTTHIAYFGELGGEDEYILADLLKQKKITKQVVCHIVGTAAAVSQTPVQFGHAKALAGKKEETARAKRDVLKEAGAQVSETFEEFVALLNKSQTKITELVSPHDLESRIAALQKRKKSLFTTTVSRDVKGEVEILGENQLDLAKQSSFAEIALSMFLGKKVQSKELIDLVDLIFKLLVDNGPYVSGAVNTMIAARAGKDLVSSMSAGLLTIGPRFGGAVNQAASNWLYGVSSGKAPDAFVEEFATKKQNISGIGHKKYRADFPDPRVSELLQFTKHLEVRRFLGFAQEVEKITLRKKGTLILNVDGLMAALLLDFLSEKEGYPDHELQQLIEVEFFNAFFVLPRSVGFMAHFFDQKRLDEGLFRLDSGDIAFCDLS